MTARRVVSALLTALLLLSTVSCRAEVRTDGEPAIEGEIGDGEGGEGEGG